MRKSTALFLLLVILCGVAVPCWALGVYDAHDRVDLQERILLGDASMVEDVTINLRTHYDWHLFWNTTFCPGENPTIFTDYRFSAERDYEPQPERYVGVQLESFIAAHSFHHVLNGPLAESSGIEKAFDELAEDTPAGQEKTRIIRIKDYLDIYPIGVSFRFPGCEKSIDMDTFVDDEEKKPGQWGYDARILQEYFKFPVMEDELYEISVRKNSAGNITNSSLGPAGHSGNAFHFYAKGGMTEEACYFTFDALTDNGAMVDLSLLPHGFGIYRLPRNSDPDVQSPVLAEELEMVFPLDPSDTICDLSVSPEQDRLLLYTMEENTFYLTVIDIDTMEQLQKLALAHSDEEYFSRVIYEKMGYIVFFFDQENLLIVLERREDGLYDVGIRTAYQNEEIVEYLHTYDLALDYDGERLVVAKPLVDGVYWSQYTCGLFLAVFDKTGMIYYGEYQSSLDSVYVSDQYDFNCRPMDYSPLTVQWDGQ